MPTITEFDNIDDMLSYIQEGREEADAAVGPEARQFVPGTHYARFIPDHGLLVYGEIIDPIESERQAGADEDEIEFQRQLRDEPHMKHMRFTKSYSEACAEGEFGDVHVSTMHVPLTKEEFERAKANAWPNNPRGLFEKVLEIPFPTKVGSA